MSISDREGIVYRTVFVQGEPIFYATSAGSSTTGLPVIFVHGVGLSHRYLLPTARLLAEEFPLYIPDLPGFGDSFKPDRTLTLEQLAGWVAAWMETLGLERAAFLGNSLGCQVITSLAVEHPDRVGCAILQGLTVDPEARTYWQQFARWRRNQQVEGDRKEGMSAYRDYWKCGIWRILVTYGYAIDDHLEEKLSLIHCPTLVIRGSQDPIVSQEWSERAAGILANGRLIIIPGEGHTINYANPSGLVRVVRPFLQEH